MLRKVSIFKKVKKILISKFEGKTAEKSKTLDRYWVKFNHPTQKKLY